VAHLSLLAEGVLDIKSRAGREQGGVSTAITWQLARETGGALEFVLEVLPSPLKEGRSQAKTSRRVEQRLV